MVEYFKENLKLKNVLCVFYHVTTISSTGTAFSARLFTNIEL